MYDFHRVLIETVLDHLDEGVYFTDMNMNILYWNKTAEAITGYTSDEASIQQCCQIISHTDENGEQLCEKHCMITEVLASGLQKEAFLFLIHKNGQRVPVTIKRFPVYNADNEMTGFIELITDNTNQKIGQAKMSALTKAAYMDPLSEMFSKQYIESRLQALLAEPAGTRKPFSILFINVAGFRDINETYGVLRSDQLLKMVAKKLSAGIRFPNMIGRWHGASFIAIIDTPNKSLLLLLIEKLKALVSEAGFPIGDETIAINITVGYAIAQSYDTVDYLIERATKSSLEEKAPKEPAPPPVSPPAAPANVQKNRFHSAVRSKR